MSFVFAAILAASLASSLHSQEHALLPAPPQAAASAQQAAPGHPGTAIKPPMLVQSSEPSYTKEAHALKISGNVLVGLTVDEKGVPQNVHVLRGLGYGLDENAVATVKSYRFTPARRDGQKVSVEMSIAVNFTPF